MQREKAIAKLKLLNEPMMTLDDDYGDYDYGDDFSFGDDDFSDGDFDDGSDLSGFSDDEEEEDMDASN